MSIIEKALAKKQKPSKDSVSNQELQQETYTSARIDRANGQEINIDNNRLTERGFIHSGGNLTHQQEEFRHIKRKLLGNAFGRVAKTLHHSNLIMVTSANPNEGKTFVSINLALSIALEQDKTVLLIDADVLRPSVHRELEFDNKLGLLDYLTGDITDLSEIISHTSIPNLRLMSAGNSHHLTNELLASERMASLAKELAERYPDRVVIFDCPPLLGVTETPVLANLVGQAVVVVEESKTKIEHIKNATSQLNEDLALGFVLNKTIKTSKDVYGYYGYGYGSKR